MSPVPAITRIAWLYGGTCILLLLPALLNWTPASELSSAPLTLALQSCVYRSSLFAAIAQLSTHLAYHTGSCESMPAPRLISYIAVGMFLAGNGVCCSLQPSSSVSPAEVFMQLWACCKLGGIAFTILCCLDLNEKSSRALGVFAFSLSCVSLLSLLGADHVTGVARSALLNVRFACLTSTLAIIAHFSLGILQARTEHSLFNLLNMTLVLNISFLALYLVFVAPDGITYQSDVDVVKKIVWMIITYFACDLLTETSRRRQEAQTASIAGAQSALLSKMFPKYIIGRLLQGLKTSHSPHVHMNATFFFSDVVGFVEISKQVGPLETLLLLDELFTVMDKCAIECGIFKSDTAGDGYMAVSTDMDGSSETETVSPAEHASRMCRFALMVRDRVETLVLRGGRKLSLRMGVHTGSCVSGVVGREMPRYCFFGDTINKTHRLESTGTTGKIQTSGVTAALLADCPEVAFVPRDDKIVLKGLPGEYQTFWLEHGDVASVS